MGYEKIIITLMCSLVLMVSVAAPGNTGQVQAAGNKEKALRAYRKFLSQNEIFGYPSKIWDFKVIDVNHDGMPELLLDSVGENYLTRLCAYNGRKVAQVDTLSNRHGLYQFYNKGSVWCAVDGIGQGSLVTEYCKMKNGKVKTVAVSVTAGVQECTPTYKIGQKGVSKKKFKAYIRKLVKKTNKEDKAPMHDVTANNIKRYCK